MRRLLLAPVLALALCGAAASQAPTPLPRVHQPTTIIPTGRCVAVDGDTFSCGADLLRLKSIYAPELGEPGADKAKAALQSLLDQPNVRIVTRWRDRWGRLIVELYVNGVRIRQRHIGPRAGRGSQH